MSVERYRSFMEDWEAFVRSLSRPEPEALRVNRSRIGTTTLARRLAGQGFEVEPVGALPGFLQVKRGPRPLSATLEHWLGHYYIQRAATGLVALALDPQPGERVLDLCAAPGGKASHIADLLELAGAKGDGGCVVANEVREDRARALLGNLYRLTHTNVAVTVGDGRRFPGANAFDRVLADVPCSGEGTARRKGGRLRPVSPSLAKHLARKQRALLSKAIELARPGGAVLYVTCTFAPEENEAVVAHALATEPVELDPLDPQVPHAEGLTRFEGTQYGSELAGAVRVYPHHLDSGGLFLARLVKLGESPATARNPSAGTDEAGADGGVRSDDGSDSSRLIELALSDLTERFGVAPAAWNGVRWTERGGRLWLHSLTECPWSRWTGAQGGRARPSNGVRLTAAGFRAMEFDSRGRPRPTNDLLRWLNHDVRSRTRDVDGEDLRALARGETISDSSGRTLGPLALRHQGEVIGRVAATRAGLKSELGRARMSDLTRVLGPHITPVARATPMAAMPRARRSR